MLKKYNKLFREDKSGRSKSFYFKKNSVFNEGLIKTFLLEYAKKHGEDARVCLHANYKDTLQDMVLIQHSKNFYPPHKHSNRYDTYHILEGCLGVVIFDNKGQVVKTYKLKKNFFYKTPKNKYHLTLPLTTKVVYHEYRSGSFDRKTNCIFPNWAPDKINAKYEFKQKIIKRLNENN
jgi:cupin fold WbuC family metalloprotein